MDVSLAFTILESQITFGKPLFLSGLCQHGVGGIAGGVLSGPCSVPAAAPPPPLVPDTMLPTTRQHFYTPAECATPYPHPPLRTLVPATPSPSLVCRAHRWSKHFPLSEMDSCQEQSTLRWLKSHPVPSGTLARWLTCWLTYREHIQSGTECPCVAWPCANSGLFPPSPEQAMCPRPEMTGSSFWRPPSRWLVCAQLKPTDFSLQSYTRLS